MREGERLTLKCDVVDADADADASDVESRSLRWTREGSAFRNGQFSLNAVKESFNVIRSQCYKTIEQLITAVILTLLFLGLIHRGTIIPQ